MRKAVIFGLGARYRQFRGAMDDEYHIVALADNDPEKQGMMLDGLPVIRPCAIPEVACDAVLVTPRGSAAAEMTEQLRRMGIPCSKIAAYDKERDAPKTLSPFVIDPMFFAKELSGEQKRRLFKDNVELVFIEFNSQCNRRCWMCPNVAVDRHSRNMKLDAGTVGKILSELREIDYDADISLSVFNEPMIDGDLDENIRTVKRYLPDAPVHFNTNGDYLTPKRLSELETLNLDFLPVSLYVDTIEKPWNSEDAARAIKEKVKALNLDIEAMSTENDTIVNAVCKYKSLYVFFRCANHRVVASDRCGAVPENAPVRRNAGASRICDRFFTQFTVNYSGAVLPCSNFHVDFSGHKPYIVGDAGTESIFDIYACEKWNQLRRQHIFDISRQPCCTCGIISDVWGDVSLSVTSYQPFRDRPRYRK